MPTDREQEIAYHLGGSVRIPSPAPATGSVQIIVRRSPMADEPDVYLRVTHKPTPRLTIARTVHLDDVLAVQSPGYTPPKTTGPPEGTFYTAKEVAKHVKDRIATKKASPEPPTGAGASVTEITTIHEYLDEASVYVPESASVLMTTHVGMSAVQSMSYIAPLGCQPNPCED